MKLLTTFLSLFILISVIGGIVLIILVQSFAAPGPLPAEKTLLIENGMGVSAIATRLEKEQIISSPFLFKTAQKLFGKGTLKAGEYRFKENISMVAVLEQLELGKVVSRNITIPEGLTSFEIVTLLNDNKALEGELTSIPAEGSLLPETYSFTLGDTKADKIKRMQENMVKTIDELWETRAEDLPIKTKKEAVILASIIEKETGIDGERRKVAGVFINRLNIGMPLQTDPTVIYAITKGRHKNRGKGPLGRRLLRKDMQIDSPYNTYKYPGLPPGPIANPGKEAIAAALNPEKHKYLYFVADGTGGHIFGKTLKEHNYNAANWRKIRDEKAKKATSKTVIEDEVNEPLFE